MGNNSVLITEHRYSPTYDLSSESGIYCVQFMVFKNDVRGNIALNWWRDKCIDWCYARHEDGKFGDQKYLDDWLTRFEGVHSLKNLGGGIAPWNIEQYNFFNFDNGPKAVEIVSGQIFDVIFYHYHSLKLYKHGITLLTSESYGITNNSFEIIYKDYINRLNSFLNILENSNTFFRSELKGNNIFISLFYFYFLQIKNIIKKFLNQNYGRSVFYSNYKIVK
jgi:hypothetical protein